MAGVPVDDLVEVVPFFAPEPPKVTLPVPYFQTIIPNETDSVRDLELKDAAYWRERFHHFKREYNFIREEAALCAASMETLYVGMMYNGLTRRPDWNNAYVPTCITDAERSYEFIKQNLDDVVVSLPLELERTGVKAVEVNCLLQRLKEVKKQVDMCSYRLSNIMPTHCIGHEVRESIRNRRWVHMFEKEACQERCGEIDLTLPEAQ